MKWGPPRSAGVRRRPFSLKNRFLGHGSGPTGEKMVAACRGVDSQVLATILDPFGVIFVDLGPDDYLRLEHSDIAAIEASETPQLSVLRPHN